QCRTADLALHRQLILLSVGQNVAIPECRRSSDGQEIRPVDWSIRARQPYRESLAFHVTGAAIYERRHKLRRYWAAVEDTERCIADFVEVRGAFKRLIEHAPTKTNTRTARPARERLDQTRLEVRRIRNAD